MGSDSIDFLKILLDKKLRPNEKVLYAYLKTIFNNGKISIINSDLGKKLTVSDTAISRILNSLNNKGYIDLLYDKDFLRYIIDSYHKDVDRSGLYSLNEALSLFKKDEKKDLIRTGYIYILKSDYGYKIGLSAKIRDRLQLFSVKLPFKFEILGYYKVKDMYYAESHLHKKYQKFRIRGEWFKLQKKDIEDCIDFLKNA